HSAARSRAHEGRVERYPGIGELDDAGFDARAETQMELDIGRGSPCVGIPEAARLEEARRDWTVAEHEIPQAGKRRPMRPCIFVVGVIAGAFRDYADIDVV